MLLELRGKRPSIHGSAYVAPTATVCGDVTIGEDSRILVGAVVTAQGGPVKIGAECIVMENAVIRGTPKHRVRIGDNVLVGPRTSPAARSRTTRFWRRARPCSADRLLAKLVPIGWVAVGDPVEILPPDEHDRIWAVQEPLDFPGTVFGVERGPAETMMPEMTGRYARALRRHEADRPVGEDRH